MQELMLNTLDKSACYIIAEVGLNHNGSLDLAKKLIDVAEVAGSNAVKFQKRSVDKLAIKEVMEAKDERFPEFGKTYREIREHLEFDEEQYIGLKEYAEKKGLDFIVTAFDIDAVDFLLKVGVNIIKVASHSLTNIKLLEYLALKKVQTILSTGMADINEIDRAVNVFKGAEDLLSILHCVSSYPTPNQECNLKMIQVLKNRYHLRTGYSGHEIGYLPTVLSVALGAAMVERHITLSKGMIGFDHKISLEPDELMSMVKEIRLVNAIIGDGKKKVSDKEQITRNKYHVSMVSAGKIKAGEILTESMVTYKNPGTGIPFKDAATVLGKTAKIDIDEDILLNKNMFLG
jgi:sialic acid synthase SpsE